MEYPFVSVVMCVYDGELFLEEQLQSILNQTFKNIEIIILDDGSTDLSWQIIAQFAETDSRIKSIKNACNLGFNKNFDKGISLATGNYISIADQDDIWNFNKIERLISEISIDDLLVYSNSEHIDSDGNLLSTKLNKDVIHVNLPTYKNFLAGNFITGHTCLFKKELVKYICPFPENIYYYDWWIGLIASYIGKVKYVDEVLTKYRIHSQSVIQSNKEINKKDLSMLKREQLKSFIKLPFIKSEDKLFVENFIYLIGKSKKNVFHLLKAYTFLFKHHDELFPWYNKSFIKKLNFIRKKSIRI